MKSFFKFLKENKVDESIDIGEEQIYSVVNGDSLVKEENLDMDNLSFDEIADLNMNEPDNINEEEDESEGGVSSGFGGEEYVSLDAPSLMDGETTTNESKTNKKKKKVKAIK